MGLQMGYSFRGINLPQAYLRVDNIVWYKKSPSAIQVGVYASKAACEDGTPPVDTINSGALLVSDGSLNLHQQAYGYLKTLPGFSDAVDA